MKLKELLEKKAPPTIGRPITLLPWQKLKPATLTFTSCELADLDARALKAGLARGRFIARELKLQFE